MRVAAVVAVAVEKYWKEEPESTAGADALLGGFSLETRNKL